MKLIRLGRDLEGCWGRTLKEDVAYLVEDLHVAHLASRVDGDLEVQYHEVDSNFSYFQTAYEHIQALIIMSGGMGDLLCLSKIVNLLARQNPSSEFFICVPTEYFFLLEGSSNSSNIHYTDYPYQPAPDHFDVIICLEAAVLRSESAQRLHLINALAAPLTILQEDHQLSYQSLPQKVKLMQAASPKQEGVKFRVALQIHASSPTRSYPPHLLVKLINSLCEKGVEVALLGNPGLKIASPPNSNTAKLCLNMMDKNIDLEHLIAYVEGTCDLVIAPDSFWAHMANALQKPLVCVMGSFDPALRRTPGHKLSWYFDGRSGCEKAPCHHSGLGMALWPKEGPCNQANECVALTSITPERIVLKTMQILEKL